MRWRLVTTCALIVAGSATGWAWFASAPAPVPTGREEVVFWHFWGGRERAVVETIVARFNASQDEYHVRPVAMPGNNLDLKFFLATTGGANERHQGRGF